ncbi:MAG: hypothetical protein ACE5I9_08960 [Candidatus Methylomirabilales bacterium]
MKSAWRIDLPILVGAAVLLSLQPIPLSATVHEAGSTPEPLRPGPLQVEGRFSGDLFLRGRTERGTVKPVRADALEWRNRTRGEARLRGADGSPLAGQGVLTLVLEGETSDGSPVLSWSELSGKGAPRGYALKTAGVVASELFRESLGGPFLGVRYGFLPPTLHVSNGEFLEYDEDVRLYQVGVSAHLPLGGSVVQEVALGASANSAAFDPDITERGSLDLTDLYRLEWSVRAAPLGPLALRYTGSFEAWQEPERVAQDVARGRYALPFAFTAAREDFQVLRNNLDGGLKLGGGVMLKLALETVANLAASRDNFAVSAFGSFMFPSPAGPIQDLLGIDRFLIGGGFYQIDRFAFINLNINRSPIGHDGGVVRLLAVNELQSKFFRRLVYGVELNFPGNSEFPLSFGNSVRYFVRLDFDTGWL